MSSPLLTLLPEALGETLVMVGVSAGASALLGIPLGIVLRLTDRHQILARPLLNRVLGALVNATRSTPFIILMVALIPFTRLVVGTSIGTAAATVPLIVVSIPFVARLVEAALREVDPGIVEAAQAMGATPFQIVVKGLLPEALPGIAAGLTLTVVSLIGYSAMAGAVGGGGLGDLGIRYGYQRFQAEVMGGVVVVLIALVSLVQAAGDRLVRRLDHRARPPA
ncbi:methionine ABC transporter permease [Pararhodospirillum oryzae]|uniref:Methionine ABC transporter permease n=1 Tax=Pararhodospirillum oryzae TaxID=478448 RepID=A0A512H457_9PROT|nr:methionine ABC transporter permease [Pararhodospirillum oryzae]GEO80245.1 methionine ABC transporter permease [Pararhodospirillum oryzae]